MLFENISNRIRINKKTSAQVENGKTGCSMFPGDVFQRLYFNGRTSTHTENDSIPESK